VERLFVISGLPLDTSGPGYTLTRLAEAMNQPSFRCRVFAPINRWGAGVVGVDVSVAGTALNVFLDRALFAAAPKIMTARAEEKFRRVLERSGAPAVAYTFGEVSLETSEFLHDKGYKVVREKFNCSKRFAQEILTAAYEGLGLAPAHGITDALVAKEAAELELADGVFCPSPMVAQSLAKFGIANGRLIPASYGWEPRRFEGEVRALAPVEGPTLIFAGFLCVRKGAHILLEAWARAKSPGRLVIAGNVETAIQERYAHVLSRNDVLALGYRDDLPALFRSSDWFIFPSLEEGDPLVTYEAAGSGLPLIVSRMGGGAFARDGVDGLVIDSQDPDVWASVIASLPNRTEEREVFARNAVEHAADFTWDLVGGRRREQIRRLAGAG
jgi:hypothetical protein